MQAPLHVLSLPSDVLPLSPAVEADFWRARALLQGHINTQGKEQIAFRRAMELHEGIYAPIPVEQLDAFNQAYFERNLLKCLIAIHRFRNIFRNAPIRDIGCGAGPATVAWLVATKPSLHQLATSTCIDRSKHQLSIAKKIIQAVSGTAKLPSFHESAQTFGKRETSSVTLMSFYLCEALSEGIPARTILSTCSKEIIAVDYREILAEFLSAIGGSLRSSELFQETYALPCRVSAALGQDTLRVMGLHAVKRD